MGLPDPFSGTGSSTRLKSFRNRGGGGGTQSRAEWLRGYIGIPEELTPLQESSWLEELGSTSLGALSAVGNVLDIPGSMVRDTLANIGTGESHNPFDQLLPWNWTTHKGRVTGRELLTKWGMTDKNDPDAWEAADFGGFGSEVLLDPLTYATGFALPLVKGGLSVLKPVGRSIHKAGLLAEAPGVLKRAKMLKADNARRAAGGPTELDTIGSPIAEIGQRQARREVTPRMFLEDPELRRLGAGNVDDPIYKQLLDADEAQEMWGKGGVVDELTDATSNLGMETLKDHAKNILGRPVDNMSRDDILAALFRHKLPAAAKARLDDTLGGSLRLHLPFTGVETVVSPFGGRVSKRIDQFDQYLANTSVGKGVGYMFDYAAKGQMGSIGQSLARAATRMTDYGGTEVSNHLSELARVVNKSRENFVGQFGTDALAALGRRGEGITDGAGNILNISNRDVKMGDFVTDPVTKRTAEIIGINSDGKVVLRQFSKADREYINEFRSFDAMKDASVIDELTQAHGPAGWAEDSLEQMFTTFLRASKEHNSFGRAIDNLKVTDVYGMDKDGRTLRELFESKGMKLEGADGLASSIQETLQHMSDFEKRVRDRLSGKGYDIGLIDKMRFFYAPRAVTSSIREEIIERAGNVKGQKGTIFQRDFGPATVFDGKEGSEVRALMSDTLRTGRDPGVANLPVYVIERMLGDYGFSPKNALNAERSGGAFSGAQYLKQHYSDWLEDAVDASAIRADPRYNAAFGGGAASAEQEVARKIDELVPQTLEFIDKYRADVNIGRAPMYTRDLMLNYRNYFQEINAAEAMHDAGLATVADALRTYARRGSGIEEAGRARRKSIRETFEKMGHTKQRQGDVRNAAGDGYQELPMSSAQAVFDLLDDTTRGLLNIDSPRALLEQGIDEDLFRTLTHSTAIVQDGPMKRAFTKFVDRATNIFKGNVTLPFPSFANRNFVSGQFVNWTSGDIGTLGDASLYMKSFQRARDIGRNPMSEQNQRIIQEVRNLNLVGNKHLDDVEYVGRKDSAFVGKPTETSTPGRMESMWTPKRFMDRMDEAEGYVHANPSMRKTVTGAKQVLTDDAGKIIKPRFGTKGIRKLHRTVLAQGSHYNQIVEWQNRVPMYLFLREKGYSAASAAKRVHQLQFDYARLTGVERGVMRRLFPFYAFNRNMAPLFFTTIIERPGGGLGQTIRASRHGATQDQILPSYVGTQTSIPVPGWMAKDTDAKTFISKLGLAHEAPLQHLRSINEGLVPGVRGAISALGSQMNPMLKFPTEFVTGQSLFHTGPGGYGRQVEEEELSPGLSQAFANIGGTLTGKKQVRSPGPFISPTFEQLWANTPMSRATGQVRQWFDPRKSLAEKGISTLFGPGLTTLSPYQLRAARKKAVEMLLKKTGFGGDIGLTYVDKDLLAETMLRDRMKPGTPLEQMPRDYRIGALSDFELRRQAAAGREARKNFLRNKDKRLSKFGLER